VLTRHVITWHALLCAAQVASSRSELLQMLRNMALGLMPDLLRMAGGPPPEAHDFLIRGEGGWAVAGGCHLFDRQTKAPAADYSGAGLLLCWNCK
jgi:hypothetical protein